ncbi:MAG: hypothetical protein K2J26_07630, partial [Ruminococcus sp.]|nr:hypothetical protein [Ruminococcus sp.]
YEFLSKHIKDYQYNSTDKDTYASSFFRLLNILTNQQYKNDENAYDTQINSFKNELTNNKSKWDACFKKQLPTRTKDALITIFELFYMKDIAKREKNDKWEHLKITLQAIRIEINNRIKEAEEQARISAAQLTQPTTPPNNNNENMAAQPTSQTYRPQSKSTTSSSMSAQLPVQQTVANAQHKETHDDVIKMYMDVAGYFGNGTYPDFCKPTSDVTAFRITNPYRLNMVADKSRPTLPEFILIGNNLYPNPYKFRNGLIKGDEINRIILEEVYELNRTSTGTISQIIPAKVDLCSMTITEKGKIIFAG